MGTLPSEPSPCLSVFHRKTKTSLVRLEEIKADDGFAYSSDNGNFYVCVNSSAN